MSTTETLSATTGPTPDRSLRVGFIGLGSQGGPMARRIVESGYPTTLWARRPEGLEAYSDTDAVIAQTPFDLARASDLVCVCVVDDAGVEDVLTRDDGVLKGMAPGGVVAIHSTIHPETCKRLAAVAAQYGVELVDAPVSGGGIAAAERRLLVMVGGSVEAVARLRPVFDSYANPIVHMGDLGSGQIAKLLNNTVFAAQLSTAAGILGMGKSIGVDPTRLAQVLSSGTGASFALSVVGPRAGDLAAMSESIGPLLRKDVGILADVMSGIGEAHGIVWTAADNALAVLGHPR